jgi:hypothetical protein
MYVVRLESRKVELMEKMVDMLRALRKQVEEAGGEPTILEMHPAEYYKLNEEWQGDCGGFGWIKTFDGLRIIVNPSLEAGIAQIRPYIFEEDIERGVVFVR